MKQSIVSKLSGLRRLSVLGCCFCVVAAACDRPSYTYSDSVPISGSGTTFGGGPIITAGTGAAGTASSPSCGLDLAIGTPAFVKQVVNNQLPARLDVYLQLTDAEAEELKQTRTLLGKPAPVGGVVPPLTSLLNQLLINASAAQRPLIAELAARFKVTRATWPNPWALRLLEHPASEHMNPLRVSFKAEAWIVRILDGTVAVVDVNNVPLALDAVAATPERIAAIYYVLDDHTPGAPTSCENGRRELALGNEAMVEQYSLRTPEILARLDADIEALSVLFDAARPCTTFDKGGMTFHANTVCSSWRQFNAATEYFAYQWSLSNPTEQYKPTTQNLSDLFEALKADRFEPDPFMTKPNLTPEPPPMGGAGGMGGVGDTGGVGGAGGAAGERGDGGAAAPSGGAFEGGNPGI
jgi:hypothetical protein